MVSLIILSVQFTSVLSSVSDSSYTPIKLLRVFSGSKEEVSLKLIDYFLSGEKEVFIARSDLFADAACVGYLGKPVVLVDPKRYYEALLDLKNKGVVRVIIVGGPEALPEEIESYLSSIGIKYSRIWGKDRYETCNRVREAFNAGSRKLVLVDGNDEFGAILAGPLANKLGAALAYYRKGEPLDSEEVIWVNSMGRHSPVKATEFVGENPIDLSVKIGREFEELKLLVITKEDDPVYSASSLASRFSSPLLLVGDTLPKEIADLIREKYPWRGRVVLAGNFPEELIRQIKKKMGWRMI